ncbi:MAG: Asp-tRNA(Asn)/Glu-tRNA(Gln) amidotransferase GatCAB subunit A [Pseudomonadales bacterium]|mgnify:FL=1|nr:Asp-tRNA(Asn)/Glu-tRNA(Gln) amidotransferase GatCAB subunit A [Pseudomonadales bacterium]MBI25863.1 Asp-tRNA(Asn)/Glu-tRNA(Gln) amidotransferase GatCAB subunit A [Pseudomonadales bacterium]MEC8811133.1 Asp-tRNA(Asn)/Glu-tRNA(Gln) amidotransferase subunit GatA [Pseudomonadota bacterium]HAG92697.1 Asp-tRNA(Asn)/Glu-tRNA(Gln) amidotransferase GatCAB subunit A [Gammaproteobacteria bacterium]HAU12823.1 Asp-tRNA(Asn)/Glu-tRNA(Gln) amidotransferase GatCAB subunit A [Gammaproteobacteria bacterium]|tara:strand:- start:31467 stop:32921 length:1455 start_codon:yes stop_codon:yes gene_type:complete
MHSQTLKALSDALAAGDVSSQELTQHFLDRIKQHDPAVNSFITVTEEQALAQAKAADQRRAAGNAAPLTGVPIAHKDIFCTQGIKTSCASKMLDNFIAPYNATVVEKMADAGMVTLGKTNMDEFAMGSSNETSYYGPVKNPWQTEHVPGGSSGGSAAAVAARLTPAATGTDTGGSIRQPASLCGITGLKPTYGRVSRWGMIAFASSLDQGGPMTQTAEDAALLMNAMAGFDPKDSTSTDIEVPDYTASLTQPLDGLRIGLPRQFFEQGLDADVGKVVQEAIAQYEKLGATLVDIELPNTHLSIPAYYVVAPAEASSNLSRFDGVRFGYRCKDPADLEDLYKRSRGEGFGEEVKRRIMIGTYALSAGYYDAYYLKAQKVRRLIKNDFDEAFNNVDVIMGPTAPNAGFKLGEKAADPVSMYLSDIYTISVNMAGLPGISIPAGMSNGLPVGLQIIGNYFDESRLLNVAHRYQQETGWHAQLPAAFA